MVKRSRPSRATGERSYQAYVERLRSAAFAPAPAHKGRQLEVMAAVCSGSNRLGVELGVPLAWIGVTRESSAALRRLNEGRHGSLVPVRSRMGAFGGEDGWTDWRKLPFSPTMADLACLAPRIRIRGGVIAVEVSDALPEGDLALALSREIDHTRFQAVATEPSAVLRRWEAKDPVAVLPRYSPTPGRGDGCSRVDDVYAFDPWRQLLSLAIRVDAAVGRVDR